jgi:hypothetical protein
MGNKIEQVEPTARIVKPETNNNHGQVKQRIIYEISTEVKVLIYHVTILVLPALFLTSQKFHTNNQLTM